MASTPICRCRVLYLGSAVPHITKDGLHGIQEPLRELYPEEGVLGAKGIDSWLSVWSNGLLLENVDEKQKRVTRFFPIESLHYCAAVRHVTIPGTDGERVERFLPLDSPFARIPSANNPPLFACILRRTAGIKVLECHTFVAKKEMAANALVRCCFHAYADNMYVKYLENGANSIYGSVAAGANGAADNLKVSPGVPATSNGNGLSVNPIQKVEQWRACVHTPKDDSDDNNDHGELISIYDGDENHKIWAGGNGTASPDDQQSIYADYVSTVRSVKSMNGTGTQRSNRPRQLTAPSSPPPPPPQMDNAINGKLDPKGRSKMNGKVILESTPNGHQNGHFQPKQRRHPAMLSTYEFRPGWMPRMMASPTGYPPPPPPRMMPPMRAIPMVPSPMLHHPRTSHSPSPHRRKGKMANEEPIYMPSSRAMSPVASYQPGAFPYEQYYLSHPVHPHIMGRPPNPPPPPPISSNTLEKPLKQPKYKKKKDKSNSSDSESKYNTGIYRKKGHLNERAFSYSIRQEHRSRSHSSLATLSFVGPQNGNGSPSPTSDGINLTNGHSNGHHSNQNGRHSPAAIVNGKAATNGLRNGKLNGSASAPATPSTSKKSAGAAKKIGKNSSSSVTNLMNDFSLSDGEIEVIGSSSEISATKKRGITGNHR